LIPRALLDAAHVTLLQKPWQRGELVDRPLRVTHGPGEDVPRAEALVL
jgi:hypothetical protein